MLAKQASEPNPFYEPWALGPALDALDPQGKAQIALLYVQGRLIGLLPLTKANFYYGYPTPHLSNWMHSNAFFGAPLVIKGGETAFWQAVLDWADTHTGMSLFLHLTHLNADGPLAAALGALLHTHSRPAAIVYQEERALLHTDLAAEEYWDTSLSAKKRKELRRQFRRLEEHGHITVTRRRDDDGLARWIEDFLVLEQEGWKGREGSALACTPETEALFRSTLAGAAHAKRLERISLLLDGRPIAMLANFMTAPGMFSYKTAYDESFAHYSPGVLLQRENLNILSCKDIQWSDSCASADHPMIDRIWRERRRMVRVSIAIGGKARQAIAFSLLRVETGTSPEGF